MSHILLTGGAGFIGSHLAHALLVRGDSVAVLDNLDPSYDVEIKRRNLAMLEDAGGDAFSFFEGDIRDTKTCERCVENVDGVIHLAALAGVRPSIEDPVRYMAVNVAGTQSLLEALRGCTGVPFVFGSSSSVYGGNEKVPFSEGDCVDHPVSPYAASKKAGELQCFSWHRLYGNPVSCLRFFTVYGPRQRPEMAIHKFSRHIVAGESLPFFGDGTTRRDYTYVTDIVNGVLAALDRCEGYKIYNLGGSATTTLADLVKLLERAYGREAILDRQPEQPGDVKQTFADTSLAERELGFVSNVSIEEGVRLFADWYLAEREAGRVS